MSSSQCAKCGVLTATLLPSGLCPTCHNQGDPTRVAEHDLSVPDLPTATFAAPSETDTQSFSAGEGASRSAPAGPKYILGTLLGSGGMGCVYQAVQTSTGQTVAIKQLKPDALTPHMYGRFITEAQSLAVLKHPNLVCVYDFNPDPNDPQLVMELVDGAPLSKRISKGLLDPDTAARLIADAARGLHLAHTRGIIHRDLKPQNMLLTKEEVIKVSDFGLAKRLDVDDDNTIDGHLVGGTPGYMAPEQVDAAIGPCDQRTDVWGLGATLYAALVGKPPYPTGSKNSVRVLIDPFPPPRSVNRAVPPVLDAIVCKCLEKEPGKRYPSAAALADDLDRFRRGESTVAKPLTRRQRVWQRLRRTPRATVTAWAMAGVAVVGAGIPITRAKRIPADPLAERQAALRAGQELVLAENGKFLIEPKWQLGDAVLVRPTEAEQDTTCASRDRVLLSAISDPGVDRYRILARIRQLPVTPNMASVVRNRIGRVGVFWAYREVEFRDGVKVKAYMTVAYNDYQTDSEKPRSSYLAFWDMGQVENPSDPLNPLPITFEKMSHNAKLDTVSTLPGPYRTLVIDVTPDQIAFDSPGGRKILTRQVLDEQCHKLENDLQQAVANRKLGTQLWSPRSPVGVFVDRSRVAIESFVLRPLPTN